jgi:hypothetical protein
MAAELAAQAKAAKVKSIFSELGTPARMLRIVLVRSGYATEYVACLGPGAARRNVSQRQAILGIEP